MLEKLTKNEVLILKCFQENKNINVFSFEFIKNKTLLNDDSLMQSIYLLEEKKYILINKKKLNYYNLSSECISYFKECLPERQLLSKLEDPKSITELKKIFSESFLKIALSWFLKKKWGYLENNILTAFNINKEFDQDEMLLQNIYKLYLINNKNYLEIKETSKNLSIKNLLKRKLIFPINKVIFSFSLTLSGKKIISEEINQKNEINQITHEYLLSKDWKEKTNEYKSYDLKIPSTKISCSKLHPYQYIINEIRDIFLQMGFKEISGEIIQSSFWNFDALFQPQDHPAREMQDTFYLNSSSEILQRDILEKVKQTHEFGGDTGSKGWKYKWKEDIAKKNVLRTHTTSITINYLSSHIKESSKIFCIERVYRRESIDSTHTSEFEQLEGIIKDDNNDMSFAQLLSFLKSFYLKMGFDKIRFRPGYFPYTEPSVEPEVYIDNIGWVELGGAGILREEVLKPLNINSTVLAWGLGISRLAMIKLKLKDLRKLYQSDIKWIQKKSIF